MLRAKCIKVTKPNITSVSLGSLLLIIRIKEQTISISIEKDFKERFRELGKGFYINLTDRRIEKIQKTMPEFITIERTSSDDYKHPFRVVEKDIDAWFERSRQAK
jgi:hypothetical protein